MREPLTEPAWLLPMMLQHRQITPPQFAARLRARGYLISDSETYRLAQRAPRRYPGALLVATCWTLECALGELLVVPSEPEDSLVPPPFRLPGT